MVMGLLCFIVALAEPCAYGIEGKWPEHIVKARSSLERRRRQGGLTDERQAQLAMMYAHGQGGRMDAEEARNLLEGIFFDAQGIYNNRPDLPIKYKRLLMDLYLQSKPQRSSHARMVGLQMLAGLRGDDQTEIRELLEPIPISVEPLYSKYQCAANQYKVGNPVIAALLLERDVFAPDKVRDACLSVETVLRAGYLKASSRLQTVGYFDHREVWGLFQQAAGMARVIDPRLAHLINQSIPDFDSAVPPEKLRLPLYDPS